MAGSDGRLSWLALRSSALFFLGGVLVLGSALNNTLLYFADAPLSEAAGIVLNMTGFVAALVGAVGFYPKLRDRTPRLARLSLVIAAGAIAGILTLAVWAVAMVAVGAPEPSPVVALLSLLLMLSALCLFGVAILRTDAYPRPVGALLLVLVAALLVVFGRSVIVGGDPSQLFIVVMEIIESSLILGIGYLLSARPTPAGREGPSPA